MRGLKGSSSSSYDRVFEQDVFIREAYAIKVNGMVKRNRCWEWVEAVAHSDFIWRTLMLGVGFQLVVLANRAVFEWRRERKALTWKLLERSHFDMVMGRSTCEIKEELDRLNEELSKFE